MAGRLTWEQVSAPSFRDALTGTNMAAGLFSGGMQDLAAVVGDMRTRQKETASAGAINAALKISDAGKFDAALGSGGIAGFGAAPKDLTSEALGFFTNRSKDLLGNESTRTSIADVAADNTRADSRLALDQSSTAFDQERSNRLDASAAETAAYNRTRQEEADLRSNRKDDLAWKNALAGDVTAQAAIEIDTQARELADRVTNGSFSKDDAKLQITGQNLPKQLEDAALAKVDATDDIQWAVAPEIREHTESLPVFQRTMDALDTRENMQNLESSSNPLGRLYSDALNKYDGAANPIMDVIGGLKGIDEESGQISNWASTIVDLHNDMEKKYKLPREIIASVIENNLKPSGIIGQNVGVDKKAVNQLLAQMATPEAKADLERQRVDIKNQSEKTARQRSSLDRAAKDYALARQREDSAGMKRSMDRMRRLSEEVADLNEGFPVSRRGNGTNVNALLGLDVPAPTPMEGLDLSFLNSPAPSPPSPTAQAERDIDKYLSSIGGR